MTSAAAGQTWTRDAAGTFPWSNPANWSPAAPVSGPGTQLTFGGSAAYVASNDLPSPFRLNQLQLVNAGQPAISGNALQFERTGTGTLPQVIQNGSNNFAIAAPLVLNADTTFGGTSLGGSISLTGPISGTGALVTTGTLALSYGRLVGPTPDATFTGGTRLLGGTLDLWGDAGSTPAFGTGPIQFSGTTLTVHSTTFADWSIPNPIRVDGLASIRSERGSPVIFENNVTLNGYLLGQTLLFAPTARVLIDNGSTGPRAIYPGRAPYVTSMQIFASIVDTDNVAPPNALRLRAGVADTLISGTANTYLGGTIIEPNTYSTNTAVEVTAGSALGGGNVVVQSQARLRLDAVTNLAPGKTVLVQQGGAVEFSAATVPFDNAAVALIDPASSGILLLTGSPAPGLSLAGHDQLTLGTVTAATLATPYVPGAGGYRLVTQNGGTLTVQTQSPGIPVLTGPYPFSAGLPGWEGTILLRSPNNYTGGTTLNGGSLYAGSNALGSGNVNVAAGALFSTGDDILAPAASVLVNGGVATLGNANHYTGGTLLSAGVLTVSHPAALGAGTVTASGGVLATSVMIPNSLRLAGDASLEGQVDPGAGLAGNLILVGDRTLNSRNDFTISGNIVRSPGDTGSLHLNTTGILRIAGPANTYTGGTTIDGHVVVNPGSSLGAGGVTLHSGQLDVFGGTTGATLAGLIAGSGRVNLSGAFTVSGTLAVSGSATAALVASSAGQTNKFVSNLQIAPGGLLDLANQPLLLDNTATPESAVRQYLRNAYNANASGIGDWNGTGGITSSDAVAAHNGGNFKISIGYVNGAYALDPFVGGPIPGQETLPTNELLVRPALYGDFNLDGKVDDTDLAIFSGLGQYGKPSTTYGWLGGDLNYDGRVDDIDLQIFSGAGNYNGPAYAIEALARADVSLPEPAAIAFLALATTGLLARRRNCNSGRHSG
jgi:fibronectin-binding autotransporter adhesin